MNKTEQMRMFSRMMRWRTPADASAQTKDRDRSLRGKARVKARKAARRG